MNHQTLIEWLYESPLRVVKFTTQDTWALAPCPLGCGSVQVYLPPGGDTLFFKNHKQQHPNSVRCWWAGRPVPKEANVIVP